VWHRVSENWLKFNPHLSQLSLPSVCKLRTVDRVEHDGPAGFQCRQINCDREIRARQKSFVNRSGKIAGRKKEKLRINSCELVEQGRTASVARCTWKGYLKSDPSRQRGGDAASAGLLKAESGIELTQSVPRERTFQN
jgi:hypothetical protein